MLRATTSTGDTAADALDQFIPVGAPYGWRDVNLGFNASPDGFGCRPRNSTQCLMGDGSVQTLGPTTDASILAAITGPLEQQPTEAQFAKPATIPLIDVKRVWKVEWIVHESGPDRRRQYEVRWTQPDGKPGKSQFDP